jgi:uncharacterized membrane protein
MSSRRRQPSVLGAWSRLRRPRLTTGLVVGVLTYAILLGTTLPGRLRFLSAWDVGASVALLALWLGLRKSSEAAITRVAERQDTGKWAVLFLTVTAACASFVAIGAEMPLVKTAQGLELVLRVLLMGYTIVLSWAFIQVIFALHYAHDYYHPAGGATAAGLAFPGERPPSYGDFLYFSFTIGMTFQVSDVQVTNAAVRRLVLGHGIVSFLYTTCILALTINLVAGLI